jgi:hypothetical protein
MRIRTQLPWRVVLQDDRPGHIGILKTTCYVRNNRLILNFLPGRTSDSPFVVAMSARARANKELVEAPTGAKRRRRRRRRRDGRDEGVETKSFFSAISPRSFPRIPARDASTTAKKTATATARKTAAATTTTTTTTLGLRHRTARQRRRGEWTRSSTGNGAAGGRRGENPTPTLTHAVKGKERKVGEDDCDEEEQEEGEAAGESGEGGGDAATTAARHHLTRSQSGGRREGDECALASSEPSSARRSCLRDRHTPVCPTKSSSAAPAEATSTKNYLPEATQTVARGPVERADGRADASQFDDSSFSSPVCNRRM